MADPFHYDGKRVVVTGGASGVGAALVELLIALGAASVTVLDVKPPADARADYVETDLSREESVEESAAAIDGPVHVLFNNAGVNATAGVPTTIAVNYLAARRLTERLLPRMPAGGAVVNTASSAGNGWAAHAEQISTLLALESWSQAATWVEQHRDLYDVGRSDIYFFSKEVMQLWTLRWASVARSHGVRVNSVCPAPIDTPLLADFRLTMTDKVIDWTIAQAGGRLMAAREVAMPLAFLGSDAASYINGVNLVVDGGFAAAQATGQLDFAGLA